MVAMVEGVVLCTTAHQIFAQTSSGVRAKWEKLLPELRASVHVSLLFDSIRIARDPFQI
jgi:hypothetical protein